MSQQFQQNEPIVIDSSDENITKDIIEIDPFTYWTHPNINQKIAVNLNGFFQIQPEYTLQYQEQCSRLKNIFIQQLLQFLSENRKKIKILKLPLQKWDILNNGQIEYKSISHQVQPTRVHKYTNYLKTDRNITRLESQDILYNYNFTSEMRAAYKLDILKVPKEIWKSKRGVDEMIKLNEKWALNDLDLFQQYSLYILLIGNQNFASLNPQDQKKYLIQQRGDIGICRFLSINTDSLCQIMNQFSLNYFTKFKNTIFQRQLRQPQQFELEQIQKLSYKSFQTNDFINKENAYICSSCSRFHQQCQCRFYNEIAELRNVLELIQNIKINESKTKNCKKNVKWPLDNPCSDNCYKRKKDEATKKQIKLQIEGLENLIIDKDPCELSRIHKIDCLSIFLATRFSFKKVRQQYIEKLKQLSIQADNQRAIDYPGDNSYIYYGCSHKELDCLNYNCNTQCGCSEFCTKYCDCKEKYCQKKQKGCLCKSKCNFDCICKEYGLECDPNICGCCNNGHNNICSNMQILISNFQPTYIGRSEVCDGLGLFARNHIKEGELIICYYGEVLIDDEDEIRDQWDDTQSFYNYEIKSYNKYDDQSAEQQSNDQNNYSKYSLESRFCGNESRFINHNNSIQQINCKPSQQLSQGRAQIAIYALQDIKPYEEFLMNYNARNAIQLEQHPWLESREKYWNYLPRAQISKQ